MGGDFPQLSLDTIAHWPAPSGAPITRGWYPPLAITLSLLSTAVLIGRLDSQLRKSYYGIAIDDGLAGLAWIFALCFTASTVSGTLNYGFNRHIWDIPGERLARAALIEWLSEGAFTFSVCFNKISVLFFYRRLEPPTTGAMKRILYVLMAVIVTYSLACLLSQVLLCRPASSYWRVPTPSQPVQRSCASHHVLYPVQGTLDMFTTLYTIATPMLVLRKRPMSQFQRTGLRLVGLTALLVFGASLARTYFLVRLADSANGDATWNGLNVFICSQFECQLGLICASFPFLQRYSKQYPSVPIVFVDTANDIRSDSVMSRVGSSLSGHIQRLPFGRSSSPRNVEISRPQPYPTPVEIPEWEFETLQQPVRSPLEQQTYGYDRYLRGMYGPPVPPKDSQELFDQYRREHGEVV